MGKTQMWQERIGEMLDSSSVEELAEFLRANSNLPGPRGNLELAFGFASAMACGPLTQDRWSKLERLLDYPASTAPTNNPDEFLPFCACVALGRFHSQADEQRRQIVVSSLRSAASDPRWRIREAAAMGLQAIGEHDLGSLRELVATWLPTSTLLEKRAIVAALAHPVLLQEPEFCTWCVSVADRILESVTTIEPQARRTEELTVLKKGLGYALSVLVVPSPEQGFALLRKWAPVPDRDIRWIVKENLKKKRLLKRYAAEVAEVSAVVTGAEGAR